VDAGVR